jgi:hypothetical protein
VSINKIRNERNRTSRTAPPYPAPSQSRAHPRQYIHNHATAPPHVAPIRREPMDDARPPSKAIRHLSTCPDAAAQYRFLAALLMF